MRELRVIISGGGTGGHIFPAIAIANAVKEIRSDAEILFVGASGRMEMEKVPAAGYKIEGLWISGLQRKITLGNLMFPIKVMSSVMNARKIIKRFKPDVAVGVGGYASGPLLFAATMKGVPTLIQEQNSYAGITNKILGKRADKICVAYENMERFFPKEKIIITGNPVRQDIESMAGKRERGLEHFGLRADLKTVLVVGGSLGALTINKSMRTMLNALVENQIQLIWQTGKGFHPQALDALMNSDPAFIKVHEFIRRMDLAYSVADLVVGRAGASTVSELTIAQKPAILVPSPNVAEDHQTKNAMALVNRQAAILIKDVDAQSSLWHTIHELVNDVDKSHRLAENIGKLAFHNSARTIANEVIKLASK